MIEFYHLGGPQSLPANEPGPEQDTNQQYRFVISFIGIIAGICGAPLKGDMPDVKHRKQMIGELASAKAGTLILLLRDAKAQALSVINDMPYGYEIRDGTITPFPYDEAYDGDWLQDLPIWGDD